MNKPYFLTNDLEVTSGVPSDSLEEIRSESVSALRTAFPDWVRIEVISHQTGVDFFKTQRKKDTFSIAVDDGVYISNPDISFNSTRMFPDEESILTGSSYSVMTRDGKPLKSQQISVPHDIQEIWLYDDGIFSGDTQRQILKNLPNGVTRYKIYVLLNFSWKDTVEWFPIESYYNGDCIDWVDERDFYYGVKNSGASINPNGEVSGVPYISNPRIAAKKASIPASMSKKFCLTMLETNKKLWLLINENSLLWEVSRLRYLLKRYSADTPIQDVLDQEMRKIKNEF